MKPLIFTPEADDEITHAADYFLKIGRIDLADELDAEIDQALSELQTDPDLHPEVAPGLRLWRPTPKFSWRIGYKEREHDILIAAAYVSTAQENPLYWLKRVE